MTGATFVGFSSASGTGASVTVGPPSGLQAGDHQLIIAVCGTGATVPSVTGFVTVPGAYSGSAGDSSMTASAHTASASAETGDVTVTNPADGRLFALLRAGWRGGDGWLDTPAPSSGAGTSGDTHALPTQDTTAADQLVVGAIAYDTGDGTGITTTFSMPSPWVERAEINPDSSATGGFETIGIAAFEALRSSAGTQTGTVTASRTDVPFVFAATLDADSGGAVTLEADADNAASATGSASVARPLQAAAAAAAQAAAGAAVIRPITAQAEAASAASGVLAVARHLAGSTPAAVAAAGTLSTEGEASLAGFAAAASGASGALTLTRPFAGSASAATAGAGELTVGNFVCQDLAAAASAIAYSASVSGVALSGTVTAVVSHAATVTAVQYGATDIELCGR